MLFRGVSATAIGGEAVGDAALQILLVSVFSLFSTKPFGTGYSVVAHGNRKIGSGCEKFSNGLFFNARARSIDTAHQKPDCRLEPRTAGDPTHQSHQCRLEAIARQRGRHGEIPELFRRVEVEYFSGNLIIRRGNMEGAGRMGWRTGATTERGGGGETGETNARRSSSIVGSSCRSASISNPRPSTECPATARGSLQREPRATRRPALHLAGRHAGGDAAESDGDDPEQDGGDENANSTKPYRRDSLLCFRRGQWCERLWCYRHSSAPGAGGA